LRRIEKYGPSSEKLSSLQLELLEQEPGVSREEVIAESERPAPPPASERKKRPHPGRQTLPADLPCVERVIACTPEQCVCGKCGLGNTMIGYEVSEVLAVEPARYFVLVTKREKRACKTRPEERVVAATLPDRIIDKSLVSDEVIIDTVVNKYCNHSPLYRQSIALLRDAGIDISRATMCGWVMTIGEMLMPVSAAMRSQLLGGAYIQADETPVDVQTHDGSGSNHQAYLWQYGTPGGRTCAGCSVGLALASGNGSRHRGTPASAGHRSIRVDPSQGTLEKIQLLPLPADNAFQASDFGLELFDPRITPIRHGCTPVVIRTAPQLALPSIEARAIHAQFA
jgi:transposase